MDIHEYQAKEILAGFGVKTPRGGLAYSPEQAAYRAHEIGPSASMTLSARFIVHDGVVAPERLDELAESTTAL